MVDFFRYSECFDVCTVEYEEWFSNPLSNFERLRAFLDLQWQQSASDLDLVLSGIIDPVLRHDSSDHTAATHPLVRSLYEVARGTGGARRAGGHTDIVSQVVAFQRLQEPFQRAFEQAADIAAKFPSLEREAAALRSAAGERDAETEGLRARLDEVARAREGDAAALQESQSRLAECETALKEANARADEFAALLKSSELARAASLAEFEAQKVCLTALTDERDALSATTAELQSIIDRLRAAITEAEQREAKQLTDLSSVREEINSLRVRLDAARDIGKAALASLRSTPAMIFPLQCERGWPETIRGHFRKAVKQPLAPAG
jgi:hypothetical protein